jgi:hypothetical protein
MHPARFLRSKDVKAKPIVATISHVEMETVGQGADRKEKPVLHLVDQKPLIINVTNKEALEEVFD